MATRPDKNATIVGTIIFIFTLKDESIKVNNHAPKIVGIPKRSEKYIASVFFIPKYIAVTRVTPDLDTPGTKANAWAVPIMKDCFMVIWWNDKFLSIFNFGESNRINDKNK